MPYVAQTPFGPIEFNSQFADDAMQLGLPINQVQPPSLERYSSDPRTKREEGKPYSEAELQQIISMLGGPANTNAQPKKSKLTGKQRADAIISGKINYNNDKADRTISSVTKALAASPNDSKLGALAKNIARPVAVGGLELKRGAANLAPNIAKSTTGAFQRAADYVGLPSQEYDQRYGAKEQAARPVKAPPAQKSPFAGGGAAGAFTAPGPAPEVKPSNERVAQAVKTVPDVKPKEIQLVNAFDSGNTKSVVSALDEYYADQDAAGGKGQEKDWGRILGILGYTMSSVSNRPGATLGEALGAANMAMYQYLDAEEAKAKAEKDQMAANLFARAKYDTEQQWKRIQQANKDREFNLDRQKLAVDAQNSREGRQLQRERLDWEKDMFGAGNDYKEYMEAFKNANSTGQDLSVELISNGMASRNPYAAQAAAPAIEQAHLTLGAIMDENQGRSMRAWFPKSKMNKFVKETPPEVMGALVNTLEIGAKKGDQRSMEMLEALRSAL